MGSVGSACSTQNEAPPPTERQGSVVGTDITLTTTLGTFTTGQAFAEGFPGIFYCTFYPCWTCGCVLMQEAAVRHRYLEGGFGEDTALSASPLGTRRSRSCSETCSHVCE